MISSRRRLLVWTLPWIAVYLILAIPKIDQPVTDDEIYEIRNAERILDGEPIALFLPPTYDYVLAGTIRLLGGAPWVLRIPGILSAVVSIYLTVLLANRLGVGANASRFAGLSLAAHPALVQGSMLLHIDNTILMPVVLLWLVTLLGYVREEKRWLLVLSGLWLTAALFIKFSTPVLVIPASVAFVAMRRRKELLVSYSAAVGVSLAAFLAGWAGFAEATGLSFLGPFREASTRAVSYMSALGSGWDQWTANLLVLTVWFTPYLLIAFAMVGREVVRARFWTSDRLSLIYLCSISVLTYLLFSTFNHGFPKYVIPALPLLVIATVGRAGDEFWQSTPRSLLLVAAVLGSYFTLMHFDPIYDFRYTMRAILIERHSISGVLPLFLRAAFIWVLPVLALLTMRQWRSAGDRVWLRFRALMVLLCFTHGLSLSIAQARSPYQTNYSYGEAGTMVLNAYLQARLDPQDRVLATKDVLYRLGRNDQYLGRSVWRDKEAFLRELDDGRTRFVVLSVPSQSVTAHREVLRSPEVTDRFQECFQSTQIGTFTVFERVNAQAPLEGHADRRR